MLSEKNKLNKRKPYKKIKCLARMHFDLKNYIQEDNSIQIIKLY